MNFIKEKKIHKAVVIIANFLALGYSGFYGVRSLLAAYALDGLFSANDLVAFLLAAVSAGAVFELVTTLLFRANARKLGPHRAKDMQYAFRFFTIPVGILSGAIKTLYFFYPFVFNYGEVLIEFILMLVAVVLFIVFVCKTYCRKEEYARISTTIGSSFLVLYGVLAVFSLLSGVLL